MCPTLTVGSFLDTKGPLFCSFVQQRQTSTTSNLNNSNLRSASKTKRKNKTDVQNLKNPHIAPLFFGTMRLFETFWIAPKGPPFIFFDILQHNGCQKIAKGPPFYIFRHCDTVQKSHFKKFFGKFFHVPKGSPLQFFSFLQPAGVSQSPKGPPFKF